MPRNGSGQYSLPQSPFSPNTTISSTAVNSDFSDIASALTGSVAADGQTPITGPFQFAAGSATNPPLTFTVDNTSGFYLIGAGNPAIAAGGVGVLSLTSTGGTVTGTLGVSGDFSVNTNQFTVDASTGDTTVAGNAAITGTLTVTGACTFTTPLATANYAASSVTYAQIQNVTNGKVLGNYSGSAAATSEYSINSVFPRYHVQETQLQNTASSNNPSSGAWRTVVLNHEVTTEISGAGLSSNVVSLPAGTYRVRAAYALGFGALASAQLRLENTSDSSTLATGLPEHGTSGFNYENGSPLTLEGSFILSGTKNIELQVQINGSGSACPAANFGTEVYVNLIFEQVA